MRTKNVYVGNQRVVSVLNPNEQTRYEYYYHTDHLGSTTYLTDRDGKLKEHIEYTPWGEGWIEQPTIRYDLPQYLFTGKELDATGLYYYGARYYDPRISMWLSADPALGRYLEGDERGNGGIYNMRNLNLYMYSFANPIRYTDPDGLSTWTDKEGNVQRVITDDYDWSIYRYKGDTKTGPYNYGNKDMWKKVGETKYIDAFVSPDTGSVSYSKVNFGVSKDQEMYDLNVKASKMSPVEVAIKSFPQQYFDVKQKWMAYHGYLFEGKYLTGRELGNVLAGMNAAALGIDFGTFQRLAGLLNFDFRDPIKSIMQMHAPMWGEIGYQYFRSKYGYDLCK